MAAQQQRSGARWAAPFSTAGSQPRFMFIPTTPIRSGLEPAVPLAFPPMVARVGRKSGTTAASIILRAKFPPSLGLCAAAAGAHMPELATSRPVSAAIASLPPTGLAAPPTAPRKPRPPTRGGDEHT